MKVYKDAHMKIFSPYIISKNVLEKEFTTGISYFPDPYIISKNVLEKEFTTGISYFPDPVKKLPNFLWHAKTNSVQNQGHKQHVIVNMLFQKVIFENIVNKAIYYSKHGV